jgi:mannose-6-phosphate isomerase class I
MLLKKSRWSKVYESTEEELTDFLASRRIQAAHFAAEAFDTTESQSYDTEITIWCAEGSLTLRATNAKVLSLQPGDAVHIPANAPFTLQAGISGYICYKS